MENEGKPWTEDDIKNLKKWAIENVDTTEIARRLKRSEESVYQKAHSLGISLKPKDKKE